MQRSKNKAIIATAFVALVSVIWWYRIANRHQIEKHSESVINWQDSETPPLTISTERPFQTVVSSFDVAKVCGRTYFKYVQGSWLRNIQVQLREFPSGRVLEELEAPPGGLSNPPWDRDRGWKEIHTQSELFEVVAVVTFASSTEKVGQVIRLGSPKKAHDLTLPQSIRDQDLDKAIKNGRFEMISIGLQRWMKINVPEEGPSWPVGVGFFVVVEGQTASKEVIYRLMLAKSQQDVSTNFVGYVCLTDHASAEACDRVTSLRITDLPCIAALEKPITGAWAGSVEVPLIWGGGAVDYDRLDLQHKVLR